jgi:hypothetical protein
MLTPEQTKAVEACMASNRGNVKPAKISGPIELPFDLLDDEPADEADETDIDEGNDE